MAEKKITKREKFEMLKAYVKDDVMLTEFLDHEIELLTKKSSSGSAKKNDEQEAFFEIIRDVLAECADVKGMQCGAITKDARIAAFKWADGKETSSQRVSAMLKKMKDNGDVVTVTDKKVTYFSLA